MRSYLYIGELFTNILLTSKTIQGRFHICPKKGTEINTDNFDSVVQDVVRPVKGKKYPVCLMMPPTSFGVPTPKDGWEQYRLTLFFLKQISVTATNQLLSPNGKTNTSTHTVIEDWHDMKRCADDFIRALIKVCKTKNLINTALRVDDTGMVMTKSPVSFIGADNLAGIRLDFAVTVFNIGCEVEDYDGTELDQIELPVDDVHPLHDM